MSEELQGTWVVSGGEREGQPVDLLKGTQFRGARLVFQGDRVTMPAGGHARSGTFATHSRMRHHHPGWVGVSPLSAGRWCCW